MTGLIIIGVAVAGIAALILIARALDVVRGIDPDDKWSGWFRGKSSDPGKRIWGGSEYDSMNDHGNREQDGGL